MPRLTSLFAATTLVAGITAAYLWQQLHTERATTAKLEERVAQLELAQARPVQAAAAVAPATVPGAQEKPAAGAAAEGAAKPAAAGSAAAVRATIAALSISSRELMKDPDYREGIAMSLRASIAQNYPDLAKELDLTPEQLNKFLDALTKNQLASMGDPLPEGGDEATMRAAMSARQEATRKQEAELAALLGDGKYQQWKDYQQTLGVRQQVSRLRTALETSGQPLGEAQQKQLIAALAADQKRQRDEARQVPRPAVTTPRDQLAMMEESVQRTEESNRRMADAAASYLNAQQLDAFRKMQNQNLAMTRAMLRAQRAQQEALGGQSGSAAGGAGTGAVVVVPAF